jgi:PAS domain S-box-containing protein
MDEEALARLCQSIVIASSDGVIFADREGRIRLWNRGAELIFGYDTTEALGQSLDLIIPERLRESHWRAYDESVETGRTRHTDRVMTTRSTHKNGSRLYVDLNFGLVKDASDIVIGAFAIARDCTLRYEAERAARARVEALEARLATLAPPE